MCLAPGVGSRTSVAQPNRHAHAYVCAMWMWVLLLVQDVAQQKQERYVLALAWRGVAGA